MARHRVPDLAAVLGTLTAESLSLVATADEYGHPNVAAVSWLRGAPPDHLDLLVGWRSRLVRNIQRVPAVTVVVFQESVLTLQGRGHVEERLAQGLPIPLSLVRVEVEAVYDSMFTGGQLTSSPRYVKDYPAKLRHLDDQVAAYLTEHQLTAVGADGHA